MPDEPNPTRKALLAFLDQAILPRLQGGEEPPALLVVGWPGRGMAMRLPSDQGQWGIFILTTVLASGAHAVALCLTGWYSEQKEVRASQASDRQSTLFTLVMERDNPRVDFHRGWLYNLDTSRKPGTPGYVFDIRPMPKMDGRIWRSPHLEPLRQAWQAGQPSSSQHGGQGGEQNGAAA